ncbi:hypothetical protein SAMN05880561_103634 [Rhizobium sp. RU33A]|nr:hypothetical protein SAMN05880561_103634 [Rhizobium sp. RU33A]
MCRAPQGEGKTHAQASPPVEINSLRVGHARPRVKPEGSDEAPEATCLSNVCGSFRRLVRRFFPLHASLWQGGDGPWNLRSRDDRARVRLRRHREMTLQPGRWPGRFPPDGAPFRPGPSPGGWGFGHLRPHHHPRRFIRPAVWMFATALAPCLCASEARPSDRGIQLRGIRPSHLRIQPHVRRETVAAGRGFVPARARHPGAGPASPDIASSGVSEGGTGIRVKQGKWWGMKKHVGI